MAKSFQQMKAEAAIKRQSGFADELKTKPTTIAETIVFLEVPYCEKDEAKALGARWDKIARKWYVKPGNDLKLFSKWFW